MLGKIIESVTDVCITEENLLVNTQACITFNTGLFIMWPTRCFWTTCKLKLIFSLVILNMHKQVCMIQARRSSFLCFNIAFCCFIYLFTYFCFLFLIKAWSYVKYGMRKHFFFFLWFREAHRPAQYPRLEEVLSTTSILTRAWLLDGTQRKGNTEDASCIFTHSCPGCHSPQNIHEFGAASDAPNTSV